MSHAYPAGSALTGWLLTLPIRAESVEDQSEHSLGSILWPGCGPPKGAGELEEVTGIGVLPEVPSRWPASKSCVMAAITGP